MSNSIKNYIKIAKRTGNAVLISRMRVWHLALVVIALVAVRAATHNEVENGWYTARVRYVNWRTEYSADYTLRVKVRNDRVSNISFPKGGSVHKGRNNSGYDYSSGKIRQNSLGGWGTSVRVVTEDGDVRDYFVLLLDLTR